MTDLPPARAVLRAPFGRPCDEFVLLTHHERSLRRRRLETVRGDSFLVDLPATVWLVGQEAFELEDGRLVGVVAAEEPLMEASVPEAAGEAAMEGPAGRPSLPRLAWHLGNRHCACQIEPDRLLVARDPVLRDMLLRLGATVRDASEPFHPEGGAYAHGHDPGGLGSLTHD